MTKSFFGVMAAVFRGVSAAKDLRIFRLFAAKIYMEKEISIPISEYYCWEGLPLQSCLSMQ
jgi:hypothetical protein